MSGGQRQTLPPSLRVSPVIAVLRAAHASEYFPVIDALRSGGVTHVEVTLSTAGVLDAMPDLLEEFGDVHLGVGTVTEPAQAAASIAAGAHYLVTPTTNLEVIDAAIAAGTPIIPGGFTPTELHAGWGRGVSAVKVFPASHLGPGYVADLRGPFPGIEVIPSGGVSTDGALEWLRAGACAVSLGGPLLQDAFRGGDLSELTTRSRNLIESIAHAEL